MHIVTKILIVFCAVLSLLLAALTMAYAANAGALRTAIKMEQNLKTAALTAANQQEAQTSIINSEKERANVSLRDMNAALEKDITALQAERTDLRSRIQQSLADTDRAQSQIAQAIATTQTQNALIKNYRDEVTTLRESSLAGERRQIELLDKINDLSSAREVLQQNARALKEQLEELKLANQTLQQQAASGVAGVTNMATKSTPHELPGPLVRARITEVGKFPSGDDMVVINEGSNRGLKEGISMNIARGDSFVGSIILTKVEPTRSVGRVSFKANNMSAASDDVVLSRLD